MVSRLNLIAKWQLLNDVDVILSASAGVGRLGRRRGSRRRRPIRLTWIRAQFHSQFRLQPESRLRWITATTTTTLAGRDKPNQTKPTGSRATDEAPGATPTSVQSIGPV